MAKTSGAPVSGSVGKNWPLFRSLRSLSAFISDARSVRGSDAGRDCDPRADGDRPAWRLHAANRFFCFSRRFAGVRGVRQQSLFIVWRGFDDHADLRRRTCAAGGLRFAGISVAGGGAGADGRAVAVCRRDVSAGLGRRPAFDPGDDGLSRRHLRAHPGVAIAKHPRGASAHRVDAAKAGYARLASRPGQSIYAGDRLRGAGGDRHLRTDRCTDSGRLDRTGGGSSGRRAARAGAKRRQRTRRGVGELAGGEIAGNLVQPFDQPGFAEPDHRHRRHGADRGDDAIVSVRSQ